MSKLIILIGNSGSGKTTLVKELQNKFGRNTMIISQGVVRRDMLKVKDEETTKALLLMQELLVYEKNIVKLKFWKALCMQAGIGHYLSVQFVGLEMKYMLIILNCRLRKR